MMWVDYTIEQAGKNFRIAGDWFGEVMVFPKKVNKMTHFISLSDVFVVTQNGWLVKQEKEKK